MGLIPRPGKATLYAMGMRVYMDLCAWKRPYDDQSVDRIWIESQAVIRLLHLETSSLRSKDQGSESCIASEGLLAMTTMTYRTPQQTAMLGFHALIDRLGPGGAVDFIHQCERGAGNYTLERKAILKDFRLNTLRARSKRNKPQSSGA